MLKGFPLYLCQEIFPCQADPKKPYVELNVLPGARVVRLWRLPILEPDKCWNKALLCRQVCEVETNMLWHSYCFPGDSGGES